MQSLWILVSSLLFALMGVCVKLASEFYTTSEIVMYRGLFGFFFLFVISRVSHVSLKTTMPMRHLSRGLLGVIALWMWFFTISKLPLAMANTLAYMSPIWIAAILYASNWWHGKTGFSWGLPGAITLSFVGMVLLLQPTMHENQLPYALVALVSGVMSALAYLQVRQLGLLGEPETRVVFYFSLTSALAGAIAGVVDHDWHAHQAHGFVLILLVGFFASTAQLAMTRAYRLGNPLLTANLSYTGIVFSSFLGVLVWQDKLSVISWIGITVIIVSGILATLINFKSALAIAEKRI
jgi:S-adenosylmethionine uptake transporter